MIPFTKYVPNLSEFICNIFKRVNRVFRVQIKILKLLYNNQNENVVHNKISEKNKAYEKEDWWYWEDGEEQFDNIRPVITDGVVKKVDKEKAKICEVPVMSIIKCKAYYAVDIINGEPNKDDVKNGWKWYHDRPYDFLELLKLFIFQ